MSATAATAEALRSRSWPWVFAAGWLVPAMLGTAGLVSWTLWPGRVASGFGLSAWLDGFLRIFPICAAVAFPVALLAVAIAAFAEARSERYRGVFWYLIFGLVAATPAAIPIARLFLQMNLAVSHSYSLRPPSLWGSSTPALIIWGCSLVGGATMWIVRHGGRS